MYERLLPILLEGVRNQVPKAGQVAITRQNVIVYCAQQVALWKLLEYARIVMTSMQPQSLERRTCFQECCEEYGRLIRDFNRETPPKLHVFETHLPAQMHEFHVLGPLTDEAVEHFHSCNNGQKSDYRAIRSHEAREQAMSNRNMLNRDSEIGDLIRSNLKSSSRNSYNQRRKLIDEEELSKTIFAEVQQDCLDRIIRRQSYALRDLTISVGA